MHILTDLFRDNTTKLLFGFVVIASFFTYFYGYWSPNELFWDENYHLASAMKYINGTFFMEQHPPLGKLLIAAGEWLMNANVDDTMFIHTDYGKSIPEDFSFVGYRLFPSLLAWLSAPLLFLTFLVITKNSLFSSLLSFLYVFDNALIVHSRSAMLESTLIFGTILMIALFVLITREKEVDDRTHMLLLLGASFGITISTKVTGLIMVLLLPALLWRMRFNWGRMVRACCLFFAGALVVWASVWYLHFALGTTPHEQLENSGYYQASDALKTVIDDGRTGSIGALGLQLKDHLLFGPHYNRGVPALNLCKPSENGSPWFFWPLGGRSINYRWESFGPSHHAYLYLQSNPVIWIGSLAGIVISLFLLAGPLLFPEAKKPKHYYLLMVFSGLYLCYMIAISQIDRVMYLYHYFPPLVFSFLALGCCLDSLTHIGQWKLTNERKVHGLLLFSTAIFLSFLYFQPLTYYQPMNKEQIERRSLLDVWDMHCVGCEHKRFIARPTNKK